MVLETKAWELGVVIATGVPFLVDLSTDRARIWEYVLPLLCTDLYDVYMRPSVCT